MAEEDNKGSNHKSEIQIDRKKYTATQHHMTGAELRKLADPDIGPDRDLLEIVPGHPDRKIGDDDVVEIKDGLRFFSTPRTINPGAYNL